MIGNGDVCSLLCPVSTWKNHRLQSGAAVARRSLSDCKRYSVVVASLPITQTSRSVRIKSDLLSHQTSPAGCRWLFALKPETHSLSQGDSKMRHTRSFIPYFFLFLPPTPLAVCAFLHFRNEVVTDLTEPVPGNFSALGRSQRDAVWSTRSLRQECRC